MESGEISESPGTNLEADNSDRGPGLAIVPDHSRETVEKTTGKGDLQDSPGGERDEATCSDGGREEEEGSDADSDEEYDEAEYDDEDDDDMFFDQFNEPSPQVLQRNNSMKEPMVPYGCNDTEQALQHFMQVFEERYGKRHPRFFVGSLENAVKKVTDMEDPDKLRPLVIFIHNDKSILAHVFCSEVLCSEAVVDFLNTNYIIWPWDITNQENKEKLLSMVEDCFSEEPQDDEQSEDKSFEVLPPWFKQPPQHRRPFSPAEHVPPKSVLQQLVARVDDLPACLIFYPISGQPHSIQGTWLASKSTGDMSESFLGALVSSVEDYKVLLQQSQNSKEDKKLYDFLQRTHMQLKQGQTLPINPPVVPSLPLTRILAPPTGPAPSFTLPQVNWGDLLQNIQLVTNNESNDPTTQDQAEDQLDTMVQVQQEQSETKVDTSESRTEDSQEQETAENNQFHLNTDSSNE